MVKNRYDELKSCITETMRKIPHEQRKQKENCFRNKILSFCEENKTDIGNIIIELHAVYKAIMRASQDLDLIFSVPLDMIRQEYHIKTENLHKEEFFNAIINDEFIKALIIEIKTKDLPDFLKLRPLIKSIEDDMNNSSKDMRKLVDLLEKLRCLENGSGQTIIDTNPKVVDEKALNDLIIQSAK